MEQAEKRINVIPNKSFQVFLGFLTIVFFVLMVLLAFLSQIKEITIVVDGEQKIDVATFSSTVERLFMEQGINLGSYDAVNHDPDTPLEDGMEIEITKAFEVFLNVGNNKSLRVVTLPDTVENIIEAADVELGPDDRVSPELKEFVEETQNITVVQVRKELQEETREIGYKTVTKTAPDLERGIRSVLSQGKNGKEKITWEVTYENDREVSREEVKREIVQQPQDRVVAQGTLQVTSRGGDYIRFRNAVIAEATAYTHTGNLTYTDTRPKLGTISVDPEVIPLGSKVYVEGYGYGRAEDIGSAIRGERIDLFFNTREEALRWGRKEVKVYILE